MKDLHVKTYDIKERWRTNLFTLIKIASTLSVTSLYMRDPFSVIRRLWTWLHASITVYRLSTLALMHIDDSRNIHYEKVVKMFLNLRQRKNTSIIFILSNDTEVGTRRWNNL